jgi:hypothetical protein
MNSHNCKPTIQLCSPVMISKWDLMHYHLKFVHMEEIANHSSVEVLK